MENKISGLQVSSVSVLRNQELDKAIYCLERKPKSLHYLAQACCDSCMEKYVITRSSLSFLFTRSKLKFALRCTQTCPEW
eukprot:5458317-Amphidinium_carterae.1